MHIYMQHVKNCLKDFFQYFSNEPVLYDFSSSDITKSQVSQRKKMCNA